MRYFVLFLAVLLLPGGLPVAGRDSAATPVPISVETLPVLEAGTACSGRFVTHDLDHITTVPGGERVRQFEANGGGVGINDLDNDGDLDIVLANHANPNTILWNEGHLKFRTERLNPGDSRAVIIVDLDADGWQDIIFSRTKSGPTYWHNNGSGQFEREFLEGVSKPLYAINLADLDHDDDLDLVGATYDASLLADFGTEFLASGNSGVYYYENDDGYFRVNALATRAQALALVLVDINRDGHLDIQVGNDFDLADQIWYRDEAGWLPVEPYQTTSHSTMSLDFGDIDNDGQVEIFSTDMLPLPDETPAEWGAVFDGLIERPQNGDPQMNANVLNSLTDFADKASPAGIAATGWSWAGKFGDLNQDGLLDVYVVNGFIEAGTFAHLPNYELVEANQAFRNTGSSQFVPVPEWGLGSLRSGRGMSMADLDGDGDLDIVVNNLRTAAELFENQLCEGSSLQVDLFWQGSGNTRAVGATLILHTEHAAYYRDVRTASGYISGDAARIHFGFPDGVELQMLEIRWSDGGVSTLDLPAGNALLRIIRG